MTAIWRLGAAPPEHKDRPVEPERVRSGGSLYGCYLTPPGGPRQGLAVEQLVSDSFSEIWELLGGVTLDQDVPVIQGVEINFDDIGTGVVDPHDTEPMTAH